MTNSLQEQQREAAQKRFDAARDARERNRLGQFATPFPLALQIAAFIKTLWDGQTPVRFLEPSIGTGAFYSALKATFAPHQIAQATGIELDPVIAHTARELWGSSKLQLVNADFTTLAAKGSYNLILANPPYVRHHHLPANQKQALQARIQAELGLRVNGLAGLYSYFVLLADRWLAADGLAAWLIPSEFMDVNYGAALRRYLSEQVTLLRIHRARPAELQFEDALVSSAIVVFRKRQPSASHTVCFSLGGTLEEPDQQETLTLSALQESGKWTRFPMQNGTETMQSQTSTPFAELFTIKRGIATGANEFFILPRTEAKRRGLPEQFLRPVLPSPRYLTELVILDSGDGFPALPTQYVLLDCALPREQIIENYPALSTYLDEGERNGLDRRYLATRRTPWYRQEQRDAAPFLCTYMGRDLGTRGPFRFFWNQSHAVATNVYLLLYPKPILAHALRINRALYREIFERLQALDLSALMQSGRVYGGALHKIEPRELSRATLTGFELLATSARQLSLF